MDKYIDITINTADVFAKCQKLSSFEGRESVSAVGESDYAKLHIDDQDKPLINDYIRQAAHDIETALGPVVYASAVTGTTITYTLGPTGEFRINRTTLNSYILEAMAAYVLAQWCDVRLPQRKESYTAVFGDMVKACISNAYAFSLPTKRRRTLPNRNDVITMEEDV